MTIATIEGTTAGHVSAGLAPHLRSTGRYLGGYVLGAASDKIPGPFHELAGGFREEDAIRLATAVAARADADVGLAVTVSSSEAENQGAYHIGLTGPQGPRVVRGRSMPSPEVTMQRGATQALIELVTYLASPGDPGPDGKPRK